jgi:hypothetical protein
VVVSVLVPELLDEPDGDVLELDEPDGAVLELDELGAGTGTTVVDDEDDVPGEVVVVDRSAALRSPHADSAVVVPATRATMSRRFMGDPL